MSPCKIASEPAPCMPYIRTTDVSEFTHNNAPLNKATVLVFIIAFERSFVFFQHHGLVIV